MKRLLQTAIFVFLYFSSNFLVAQPYPEWEQYISPNGGIWECKIKDKILYCGTYGAGLIEYNLETKETIPYTVYNSGLASNEINDVDVDIDGNIWLGHWGEGVSKINAEACEVYNTANSELQNDTVNTICVDHNNKIWIGTRQGIDVIDGEDWIHYDKSNSGMTNNLICTIEVDTENNKWIGSVNSFFIFDDLEWNVYSVNWQQEYYFEEIAVVDSETAYFDVSLFGSGLFKFQNGALECLYWPGPLYKYITDLDFDGDGNLWISLRNANSFGIAMYNGSEFNEYSLGYIGNECRTLNVDQDNNIWLGIEYKGLYKFDNNTFERIEDGLFSCGGTLNIAIENDNSIWFVGGNNLVEFSSGDWIKSNDYMYGFHLMNLQEIDVDSEGFKWIASRHELIKFDENYWLVFTEMNSPLSATASYIKDILIDKNDNLWIAEDGLLKYDGNWTSYNTNNSLIPTNQIFSLGMDSTNVLWMGGSNTELISFDGETFHVYDSIVNINCCNFVQTIFIDSANTKWFGTGNGLVTYDNTNWFLYDTLNSGLPDNWVRDIELDKTGNIWVGTNNGIGVLKNGNWTVYNSSNSSLFGNCVNDIEVSENNTVWISASGGFSRYNENGFMAVTDHSQRQGSLQISSYPNPFSDITNIQFSLSNKIAGILNVYNMTGEKLKTIKAGSFLSGENSYSWDGTDDQGELVKGGIYFCQFLSEKYSGTVKLIRY